MDPFGRVMMGGLAVVMFVMLLRATMTGVVYNEGDAVSADDNPSGFVLNVVVDTAGMFFFGALAAGYTIDDMWQVALKLLNLKTGMA